MIDGWMLDVCEYVDQEQDGMPDAGSTCGWSLLVTGSGDSESLLPVRAGEVNV